MKAETGGNASRAVTLPLMMATEFHMLTVIAVICIIANLVGIASTLFVPHFPAPCGRVFNVAVHAVGTWCGFQLLN